MKFGEKWKIMRGSSAHYGDEVDKKESKTGERVQE